MKKFITILSLLFLLLFITYFSFDYLKKDIGSYITLFFVFIICLYLEKILFKLKIPIISYFLLFLVLLLNFNKQIEYLDFLSVDFKFIEHIALFYLFLTLFLKTKSKTQIKSPIYAFALINVFLFSISSHLFVYIIQILLEQNTIKLVLNSWIVLSIFLTPAPFMINVFYHQQLDVKKLYINYDSIYVKIFLFIVINSVIFMGQSITDSINRITLNILLSFTLYFISITSIKYLKRDFILIISASVFVFTYNNLWITTVDFILTIIVFHQLINENRYIRRVIFINIKGLQISFIFIISIFMGLKFKLNLNNIIISLILFTSIRYIVYLITCKFKWMQDKFSASKIQYYHLFQGIIALYFIEFLFQERMINSIQTNFYMTAIFVSFIMNIPFLLFFNKQLHIRKSIDSHMNNQDLLNETGEYIHPSINNLSHNIIEYENDLLQIRKRNTVYFIEKCHELDTNLIFIFDKLEKEINSLRNFNIQIIKEKIRENRNLYSNKYYQNSQLNKIKKNIKSEFETYKQYHTNLYEEIDSLKSFTLPYDKNLFADKNHFFKNAVLKIQYQTLKLLNYFNNNKMQRIIPLKYISSKNYYHLYKNYYIQLLNIIMFELYDNEHRLHNIFLNIDKHFVMLLLFVEKQVNLDSKQFIEKLLFLKKDFEKDFNFYENQLQKSEEIVKKHFRLINSNFINCINDSAMNYNLIFKNIISNDLPRDISEFKKQVTSTEIIMENWEKVFNSFYGHQTMDFEISLLQNKIRKFIANIDDSFNEIKLNFNEKVLQHSVEINKKIKADIKKKFEDNNFQEKDVIDIRKKWLYFFKINVLKELEIIKEKNIFSETTNVLLENLHSSIQEIPKHIQVANIDKSVLSNIHNTSILQIETKPLRQIIRTYLEIEITNSIHDLLSYTEIGMEELFNLIDSSIIEIDSFSEQILQIYKMESREELEKLILNKCKLIHEKSEQINLLFNQLTENIIKSLIKNFIDNLKQISHKIDLDSNVAVIESSSSLINDLNELFTSLFTNDKIKNRLLILKDTFFKTRKILNQSYKKLISAISSGEEKTLLLSDYLQKVNDQIASLPFMYKKIFNLDSIELNELLLNREKEITHVIKTVDQWIKGTHTRLNIIGDMGNGKTSFINCLLKYHLPKNIACYRFKISELNMNEQSLAHSFSKLFSYSKSCDSLEEVKKTINDGDKKFIVILESTHRLYNRTYESYLLFNKLLQFFVDTNLKVFWIHSYSLKSWIHISKTFNIENFYTKEILIDGFNNHQLKQLIYSRNKLTGYKFHFFNPKNEKIIDENNPLYSFLVDKYYKKLMLLSDGNILTAIHLWLSSIRFEDIKIIVYPIANIVMDDEIKMNEKIFFILKYIFEHGVLNSKNIETVFFWSQQELLIEIDFLLSKNILIERKLNENYFYFLNKTSFFVTKRLVYGN